MVVALSSYQVVQWTELRLSGLVHSLVPNVITSSFLASIYSVNSPSEKLPLTTNCGISLSLILAVGRKRHVNYLCIWSLFSPQSSRLGLYSETLSHQKETNEIPKTLFFQCLKDVINQNRSQMMEKANEGEKKIYFCNKLIIGIVLHACISAIAWAAQQEYFNSSNHKWVPIKHHIVLGAEMKQQNQTKKHCHWK